MTQHLTHPVSTPTTLSIQFPQMSTLQREAQAAPRILALAREIKVTNPAQSELANRTLQDLLRVKDTLDKERTEVTGPLHKTKTWIDAQYKPVSTCIQMAVDIIKAELGGFVLAQKAEQARQFQAAQQAHAQGDHQQMAAALNHSSAIVTAAPQGSSVREVWVAEVFNPAIVPHEFLIVDVQKVNEHARTTPAHLEPAPIPGVRFSKKPSVTVTR